MDIDVDWCLTCQRHIEGSYPYCSLECEHNAAPRPKSLQKLPNFIVDDDDDGSLGDIDSPSPSSSSITRWFGNHNAGIAAWAAEVPLGAPAENLPSSSRELPKLLRLPSSSNYRAPPNLIKSSHRVVPPCLCMSQTLPHITPTCSLVVTPPRQHSTHLTEQTSTLSLGKTSLKSAPSDSLISTPSSSNPPSVPIICPSRKSSILGDMYAHVRSWVSPSPAIFVPVDVPQQRHPLPLHRVDSNSKLFTLTTHPPPPKKLLACENFWGRRRLQELAYHDEHPSFRARGRKASRAAA